MIFSAGIFLRVIDIVALLEVVDYVFRSHLLDVVMDIVAKSVAVFL